MGLDEQVLKSVLDANSSNITSRPFLATLLEDAERGETLELRYAGYAVDGKVRIVTGEVITRFASPDGRMPSALALDTDAGRLIVPYNRIAGYALK